MKKVFSLMALLILSLFLIIFFRYKVHTTIEIEGIVISSENLTKNLYNDKYNGKGNKINLSKVKEYDNVYKRVNSFYIGEKEKKEVLITYPVFAKDNSKVLNVTETSQLIDENFKYYDGYNGFILADGYVFDRNTNERIDDTNYILLNVLNKIYVNSKSIKMKKSELEEIVIKANSIVYFDENKIKYYEFENGTFIYKTIEAISVNSKIEINNISLNYSNFLKKLNLLDEIKIDKTEEKDDNKDNLTDEKKTTKRDVVASTTKKTIDDEKEDLYKPVVEFSNVKAAVYSLSGTLKIKENIYKITKNPVFTVYVNNKIYSRRTVALENSNITIDGLPPSTEIRLVGTFQYKNKKEKIIEKTFYDEKIVTKGVEDLNEILLDLSTTEIFNNKISFSSIKLNNDKDDEVLKGIKKVIIEIDDKEFNLSLNDCNSLKKLKTVSYSTTPVFKSNSKFDYRVRMLDLANNELKVNSAKGVVRTSKKDPIVELEIQDKTAISVGVKYNLVNDDDVILADFKYILYDRDSNIIKENNLEDDAGLLLLDDLNINDIYKLNIYATYDLEDGRGKVENSLLNSINLITGDIEKDLYIDFYEKEIKTNYAKFEVGFGKNNQEIMSLLVSELVFTLLDENGNVIKDAFDKSIQKKVENPFKNEQKIEICFDNLDSNTDYKISFAASIKQNNNKTIKLNVKNSSGIGLDLTEYKFVTMKKPAKINIQNLFVGNDSITYELNVTDIDEAILNNEISINLYEIEGILETFLETRKETINDEGEYKRLNFNNLDSNKKYLFRFKANKYSEIKNDKTGNPYILHELEISLENGIEGNIELSKLTKKINTNKNLFNINNSKLWSTNNAENPILEIESEKNSISLGQTGKGITVFSYYLPDYNNQEIYVDFVYKYNKSTSTNSNLYLIPGKSVSELDSYLVTNKKGSSEYNVINNKIKVINGYISFVVKNDYDEISSINIKNLYIGKERLNDSNRKEKLVFIDEKKYINESTISISDYYKSLDKYYVKIYKYDKDLKAYSDDFIEYEYDIVYENDFKYTKNIEFDNEFDPKESYKISLIIKPFEDYSTEYEISSYEFSTYNETRSINNIKDLLYLQENTSYVVNKDLDFRDQNIEINDYIFNETFNGSIDFQGHRIDIYSHNPNDKRQLIKYYFNTIGNSGELKNFDLHVHIDGQRQISGFSFVRYNNGKINNFKVTLESSTIEKHMNLALLCYGQNKSGEISNFVGYLKSPLYVYSGAAIISVGNRGTIKNGYIYGADINAVGTYASSDTRSIAGFVSNNDRGGLVSNVYSLVKVNNTDSSLVANLVSNTSGDLGSTTKNSYSVSELGTNRNKYYDPNFTYAPSVDNVYYWNDASYTEKESDGHKSIKINEFSLNNSEFQNNVLNKGDNQFIIDNFVNNGYYPHVNLYEKLPRQDSIALPRYKKNLLEITNIEVFENENQEQKLRVKIYNPERLNVKITNISIFKLPCTVEKQISNEQSLNEEQPVDNNYIYVILDPKINDSSISFQSSYYVEQINYDYNNMSSFIKYDSFEKTYSFSLYRDIRTADDFRNIPTNSSGNYRILNKIDFGNEEKVYYLTNFKGKLDGRNNVLSNVNTEQYSLFEGVTSGSIINLKIENYSSQKGLIDVFSNIGAEINNVHIKNAEISPKGGDIGTIVNDLVNGNIVYSSVTNLKIKSKDKILFNVGGLVGYSKRSGASIQNCYVRNMNIDLSEEFGVSSIGGIAGYLYSGNIMNVYSTGVIKTSFPNAAGIIGNQNGSKISNVYSNVNIISTQNNIAGISATNNDVNSKVYNSLSLGDLNTTYNNDKIFDLGIARTIYSNDKLATNNNYAFKEQLFNGKISSYTNGEILLSLEELSDGKTYQKYLNFGDNFDYSNLSIYDGDKLVGINLPKLKDAFGGIMEYQEDFLYDFKMCYKNSNNECINKNIVENKNYEFEILSFSSSNSSTIIQWEPLVKDITYYLKLPTNLELLTSDNGEVENFEISSFVTDNGSIIITNPNFQEKLYISNNNNEYTIKLSTKFLKAYDSYTITGINYIYNGEQKTANLSYKLAISISKAINDIDDWNQIDNTYQNYVVTSDIECDEKETCIKNKERRVNRIVSDSSRKKISGISGYSIFDVIAKEIYNLTFENITLEPRDDDDLENFGLIKISNGIVRNVDFKGITINAPYSSNVGIIGYSDNGSLENITLTGINIKGKSYVGGLVGYIKNIDIKGNITLGDTIKTDFYDPSNSGYKCSANGFEENPNLTKVQMLTKCNEFKDSNNLYNSTIRGNGRNVGGLFGFSEAYYKNWDSESKISLNNVFVYNDGSDQLYTGGVLGSGQGRNIKVNDVYVHSKGNNCGVVTGDPRDFINAAYLYDVEVNNSAIYGSKNTGGVIGNGGGNSDNLYVNNSIIIGYNNVGGLSGGSGNITNSGIMNSYIEATISKGAYVGGISATNSSSGRLFDFVYNTTIQADGTVGGIFGQYAGGNLEDTYSNAILRKKTTSYTSGHYGGVVGELKRNSKLNNNIVANSLFKASNNLVGSLVGKLENTKEFSLTNNIVLIDSNSTPYNNVTGSSTACSNCISNTYVYEPYNNEQNNGETTNNLYLYAKYENLKDSNFYSKLGFNTHYWDIEIPTENGVFPKFNATTARYQNYININIPNENASDGEDNSTVMFSMLRRTNYNLLSTSARPTVHQLPNYYVYSSGIDRFNIEFSSADGLSAFTLNGNTYMIDKKVFTFAYNYDEDINILLSDGINSKKIKLKPSDIIRSVSVYSKYYYYLSNGKLVGNIKTINGKFKHIYNNEALTIDGKIYDILENKYINIDINNFELLSLTPLYQFEYESKKIKTFYKFSLMDNEEVDKQIFVKNNDIQMISSILDNDKTTIIMDNYDNNNYLTVLGLDGVIYNLKEEIKIPDNINNKNIKYITNNMYSSSGIVLIEYKNGSVYAFDYRSGEVLASKEPKEKENIVEYFKNKFLPVENKSIDENITEIYKKSDDEYKTIVSKEPENSNNNYIRVYEPLKNKYVVYSVNDVTSKLSINDNLEKNAMSDLLNNKGQEGIAKKGISGFKILIIILLLIITSYITWLKIVNKSSKKIKSN